jgi:hypothetical protein
MKRLKPEVDCLIAQQGSLIVLVDEDGTGKRQVGPNTLSRRRRSQGQRTEKARIARMQRRGPHWGETRQAELEENIAASDAELVRLNDELSLTSGKDDRDSIRAEICTVKNRMRVAKREIASIVSQKRKQTKGQSGK